MKRILLTTFLFSFITSLGTINPDVSSILEIESSNAGVISFGEHYYTNDVTVPLVGAWGNPAPFGIANPLTTSDTTRTGGLTVGSTGGVYKVALTVTYSKQTANAAANEIEFYITMI